MKMNEDKKTSCQAQSQMARKNGILLLVDHITMFAKGEKVLKQTKPILKRLCWSIMLISLLCIFLFSLGLAQSKFPIGSYSSGEFTITFYKDGNHAVSVNDNVVVKGSYTVTQNQIVMTDKEGQYACDGSKPGKYSWEFDGKALKFEKLEDECDGRAGALSGQSWVKK
jgi:hypothetical protein